MIITTASAPEGTAAYYLKTESEKRNSLLAHSILKKARKNLRIKATKVTMKHLPVFQNRKFRNY